MSDKDECAACLAGLRRDAIAAVVAGYRIQFPEQFDSRPRAAEACERDLDRHFEFLLPAVRLGDASLFAGYAAWAGRVLAARGIERTHLAQSVEILRAFCSERLTSEHATIVAAVLDAGLTALSGEASGAVSVYRSHSPARPEATELRDTLLANDHAGAFALCRRVVDEGATPLEVAVHVIQPCLYEIGELWQERRITVAQEHLATAICGTVLARFAARAAYAEPIDATAVVACVEGNEHSLGARIAADSLEQAGWTVHFLGADTPVEDLLAHIAAVQPALVALSAALPEHLVTVRNVIVEARRRLGADAPIWAVGGVAVNQMAAPVSALAVDLAARDAIEFQAALARMQPQRALPEYPE